MLKTMEVFTWQYFAFTQLQNTKERWGYETKPSIKIYQIVHVYYADLYFKNN